MLRPGGSLGVSIFGNGHPAFMPAWAMLAEQLTSYGVETHLPNPLSYYTPPEMDALLAGCGFTSVDVRSEACDIVYPEAEHWWAFLLTMAPRPALMSMDEATRRRFKDEYLEALRPLFREDGLCLPVSTVYATARKGARPVDFRLPAR